MALGLVLLSPYLIWLWQIRHWQAISPSAVWPALKYSGLQSILSTVLALALGLFFALGLQNVSGRRRSTLQAALILPNLIPPLFLVMSLLAVVTPFLIFPYGLMAVVAAHVLLNSGLVALALDRLLRAKLAPMAETAWVLGSTPTRFWFKVAWPQMRGDLSALALFIFSLCLTSFSIPLLLSGTRVTSLEVAIYDTIRIEGAWDQAVQLAATQAGLLLVLAWALPQPFWPRESRPSNLKFLGSRVGEICGYLPSLILITGWLMSLGTWANLSASPEILNALPEALLTTVLLACLTGLLHLILFISTAYVLPHQGLNRFLNGYLAPSAAITAFAFVLLPLEGSTWNLLKVACALTLISYPLLYRGFVHSALSHLTKQIQVARTLSATWPQILFQVVWPQSAGAIFRASAIAAVWGGGDFAVSGILMQKGSSLPLLIVDLLNHYQLDLAASLLLPLVVILLALYFLFTRSARYVVG